MMPESVSVEVFSLISLLVIRIGVALRLVPFFGGGPMPVIPWIALSVVLACFAALGSGHVLGVEFGSLHWVALAVKEAFIGVFVGIMARIAFSVMEFAGSFVGISSASMTRVGDGDSYAPINKAYMLLACAVFLLMDGHHALFTGLMGTVSCFPPGSFQELLESSSFQSSSAIKLFATAIGTAVLVSVPVFAAGMCAEIFLGLVSRITPSISSVGGAQSIRVVFVQLVAIAALAVTVSVSVDFLQRAMVSINICPV